MAASRTGDTDGSGTRQSNGLARAFFAPVTIPGMDSPDGYSLERTGTRMLMGGRVVMRGQTDDLPQSWWFASTAIPLIAATIGPLANVLSIAAIVSKWRVTLPNNGQLPEGADSNGIDIADPVWEITLNAVSLAVGFIGNFFLLCNFTKRIRYIVALPVTIICWFFATGILTGICVAMEVYDPPIRPGETYSQGYWHAVIASTLYMLGSVGLMFNMLGYFRGKYPQHFDLDDSQRTLILQTMMFFFWLAGGAAVFQRVEDMSYADALYFCDVTVLTIGFGDFHPDTDVGRGLVFVYSIFGIIFLGLMINSIRKFASSMSRDKIIKAHEERERTLTYGRSVTSERELRDRLGLPPQMAAGDRPASTTGVKSNPRTSLDRYGHLEIKGRTVVFHENKKASVVRSGGRGGAGRRGSLAFKRPPGHKAMSRDEKIAARKAANTDEAKQNRRRQKLLLLKEEKDRFDAMRDIQQNTKKFRQYYALAMSVLAFGAVWCLGAMVFMFAEKREQDISYFQGLYFCWVSLVTIGYGDLSPVSNAGKPFFVVWSLISIPIMTILISDLSDTVVASINRGTFTLAEWTVMPREGVWHDFLVNHPVIAAWLAAKNAQIAEKKKKAEQTQRLEAGFSLQDPDDDFPTLSPSVSRTAEHPLAKLAEEQHLTEHDFARRLAVAIKRVAQDLRIDPPRRYEYEEWVEFTRLIRFSAKSREEVEMTEDEEGLVEWDWIGEDSPMLAEGTEPEWVLDRLCESLNRYTRKQAQASRTFTPTSSELPKQPRAVGRRSSSRPLDGMDEEEEEAETASASSSGREIEERDPVLLRDAGRTESAAVKAWEEEMQRARERAREQEMEKQCSGD